MEIGFYGGAQTVTGANFLLTDSNNKPTVHLLIDCGLFQGSKVFDERNYAPFPYDPRALDALVVTHAHLDHIGRIPKLVQQGFRGPIYSTAPTREIAELSLLDSLGVMKKEIKGTNRPLLYDEADVKQALAFWQTVGYHQPFAVGKLRLTLLDAGHILGSAMAEVVWPNSSETGKSFTKMVFTGDLGNSPNPLLNDTEAVTDADYLVMESVYGDRNHDQQEAVRGKLEDAIEETVNAKGTLLIPAFSVERTQLLLYEIEKLMEESRIPLVPVYLDSPLAIKVTAVYKKYESWLKPDTALIRRGAGGIFNFPQLHKIMRTEDSQAIDTNPLPKIIIAGSGMSNGGRILHHEKRFLPEANSTLLLVGFQTAGSLGRQLQDGAKTVKILGEEVTVRARILNLSGYSAHKDGDRLFDFVSRSVSTLKKVFVAMGEPAAAFYLTQRLRDYLGIDAFVPAAGQKIDLNGA